MRKDTRVRELTKRLSEALNRRAEAVKQQAATSEVLRIISRSPSELQPVFEAILSHAIGLCRGNAAVLWRFDGSHLQAAAHHNAARGFAYLKEHPLVPGHYNPTARAALERHVVHDLDVFANPDYRPLVPHGSGGPQQYSTVIAVPLLREDELLGVITIWRSEKKPFTDDQIALLGTFASQAVIAIENVRLFKETKEALERQTATSEVLEAISSAQSDASPVFETIARNAYRLSGAVRCNVLRYDGNLLHIAACHGFSPEDEQQLRKRYPVEPGDASVMSGRVIISRRVEQIDDAVRDPLYDQEHAATLGLRRMLGVPMLRDGAVIGVIVLAWRETGRTSAALIDLLRTFADQAVIAIENVRLFNETKEALERQTATSEILRVISRSPTDVQPVFDTIVAAALNLCDASSANVVTFDGELIHVAAFGPAVAEKGDAVRHHFASYPRPPSRDTANTRAILTRRVVVIPDVLEDSEYAAGATAIAAGYRSVLSIPLIRKEGVIGAITVARVKAGLFPEKQIALLKTFADQAVIAIENVRLFTELEARNRDITEALEQQTATSEILRVISASPRDVQPVFDAIASAALKLCAAGVAMVARYDGKLVELAAIANLAPGGEAALREVFPRPPSMETTSCRAVLTGKVEMIVDVLDDPHYRVSDQATRAGFRSTLAVPLMRGSQPIGCITVGRPEPGRYGDDEIGLLQTFADQAVIAIENVRLFTELEARTKQLSRSVGELKALGEVGQAVSSTLDLETVLSTIVTRATQLAGMDAGAIYEYDEEREEFFLHTADRFSDELVVALRASPIRKGEGALGGLAVTREPVQVRDIADAGVYQSRVRKILLGLGHRSVLAVPLLREDRLIGGLTVNRKTPGEFAPEVVALLQTFASQSALAMQNARLFREIEQKSRELETASRHKSEFLANMSHELRTPLNAIIGFSEVLSEKLFGEINPKQEEYVADILESGRHLLSLINDILDLSKIEAGRMELERTTFHLPNAIENALTLVRERAQRHGITLGRTIDQRLGMIDADERKVKQVLLNLLSNAVKFTPEGGKIEVRAAAVDGVAEISVTDTGVGISPEDQEVVFEEFRQVGAVAKKIEGTGLGLAISRKFIELHGGKIWVTSTVGTGSTFSFTLPSR